MGLFSKKVFLPKTIQKSFNHSFFNVGGEFSYNRQNYDKIIKDSYLSNSDVYYIIKKITEIASSLPLIHVNSEEELIESSDLIKLLNKPNKDQTRKEFLEEAVTSLLTTGNVFYHKQKSVGFKGAQELTVLTTSLMDIQTNSDWSVKSYNYNYGGKVHSYSTDEIIHVKYIDPSIYGLQTHYGLSPLQASNLTLEASNNLNVADSSLLKNKGASGILTTKGENVMTPEEGKSIQSAVTKNISGAKNFGKMPVTTVDLGFLQLGMSPSDLKILESNVQKLRTFCNVFGLDSSLFNDPANKTYNNRLEAEKAMFTNSILPTLDKVLSGLNKDLLEDDNTKVIADTSKIAALQQDLKAESERLIALVNAGILDVNEAREGLGREPKTIKIEENDN